jgi:hypothetical protein
MVKVAGILLGAVLLAAGCGGGSGSGGATGPGSGCTPRGAAVSGDVDGDLTSDSTRLYSCPGGYSIVVDGSSGTVMAELTARRPRLAGLAKIDGEAGLEIVVETGNPPKSGTIALFSERRGRLLPMSILPADIPGFPFGGGRIRHAIDCTGGPGSRRVVSAEAIRNGSDQIVTRYYYDVTGLQFLADLNPEGVHAHQRIPSAELEQRFPEFGLPPFGSCMAATARG